MPAPHADRDLALDLPRPPARAQPVHPQRQRGAPAGVFRLRPEHTLEADGAAQALGSQAADGPRQRGLRTGNGAGKDTREEGGEQEQAGPRAGTEAGRAAHPALGQETREEPPDPDEQQHGRQGAGFRPRIGH